MAAADAFADSEVAAAFALIAAAERNGVESFYVQTKPDPETGRYWRVRATQVCCTCDDDDDDDDAATASKCGDQCAEADDDSGAARTHS